MSVSLKALRIEPIFYPFFYVATYVSGNKFKTQFHQMTPPTFTMIAVITIVTALAWAYIIDKHHNDKDGR
jgi:hypothetical protein